MKKLNLIMPMGGGGTRFGKEGYKLPKPLLKIYEKPFFYWATQSIAAFTELNSIKFVVLQEHVDDFKLDKEIKKYYPDAEVIIIPQILPGAVLTCQAGCKNIGNNEPILFNDCDHLFICKEFNEFCKNNMFDSIDGALLTFHSDDPKFSYAASDTNGYVYKTVEKEVISNDAICGAYYFKNVNVFNSALTEYLDKCSYHEFFVSGVYNIMAKHRKKIKPFQVDEHVSFGTPEEYIAAQNSSTYTRLQK